MDSVLSEAHSLFLHCQTYPCHCLCWNFCNIPHIFEFFLLIQDCVETTSHDFFVRNENQFFWFLCQVLEDGCFLIIILDEVVNLSWFIVLMERMLEWTQTIHTFDTVNHATTKRLFWLVDDVKIPIIEFGNLDTDYIEMWLSLFFIFWSWILKANDLRIFCSILMM